MKQNKQNIISFLQRISNILMINGCFLDNPGLFTGEMGLVLFFFRYSKYTQNELYYNYSFDLIEKIRSKINIETPINYKQGLTGIGSAIEYLEKKDYIKANTHDVLEEFDNIIFDMDNLLYMQMEDLLSISHYALWRMAGSSFRKQTIMQKVMTDIVIFMERKCQHLDFTYPTISYLKKIIENENGIEFQNISEFPDSLHICRKKYPNGVEESNFNYFMENFSNKEFFGKKTFELGLMNGIAGFGMALMTELDKDDTWISLLPNDYFLPSVNHLHDNKNLQTKNQYK